MIQEVRMHLSKLVAPMPVNWPDHYRLYNINIRLVIDILLKFLFLVNIIREYYLSISLGKPAQAEVAWYRYLFHLPKLTGLAARSIFILAMHVLLLWPVLPLCAMN